METDIWVMYLQTKECQPPEPEKEAGKDPP